MAWKSGGVTVTSTPHALIAWAIAAAAATAPAVATALMDHSVVEPSTTRTSTFSSYAAAYSFTVCPARRPASTRLPGAAAFATLHTRKRSSPSEVLIMSQAAVRLEIRDDLSAVLTLDQPGSRANTLGQAVIGELEAAVAQVAGRTDLKGLVLRSGKPGMFIAGADIKEFAGAKHDPALTRKAVQRGHDLIAAVEKLPFPTVAAIDGACMGGGLELALGFDYRLASTHPKTELGLPEVKIGLFPGWGGTQRLSRLIGPALAAELICAGEAVKPDRARTLGLIFDAVPVEKLLDEAVRLLQWAAESEMVWREARKKKQQAVGLSEDQLSFMAAVTRAQVLDKTKGQYPAPLAALTAIVKGCNLPLEAGLKIETDGFVPLVGSPTCLNLIAVFFMSQRLQKDPGVTDASVLPRPVQRVGVLGAG